MNTIKLNMIGERSIKKAAGGSTGGGGGGLKYYKLTPLSKEDKFNAALYASLISAGDYIDTPISYIDGESSDWLGNHADGIFAIAINVGAKRGYPRDGCVSILEEALQYVPALVDCEITEEEFYKNRTFVVFNFSGICVNYEYEEGQTWGEWVNSEYSGGKFTIIGEYIEAPNGRVHNRDVSPVKDSDLISNNQKYTCSAGPA